jgi:hypothetical protein
VQPQDVPPTHFGVVPPQTAQPEPQWPSSVQSAQWLVPSQYRPLAPHRPLQAWPPPQGPAPLPQATQVPGAPLHQLLAPQLPLPQWLPAPPQGALVAQEAQVCVVVLQNWLAPHCESVVQPQLMTPAPTSTHFGVLGVRPQSLQPRPHPLSELLAAHTLVASLLQQLPLAHWLLLLHVELQPALLPSQAKRLPLPQAVPIG